MGADLQGALLAFCAVLVPLGVAWAVVDGPRWWGLRRDMVATDLRTPLQ